MEFKFKKPLVVLSLSILIIPISIVSIYSKEKDYKIKEDNIAQKEYNSLSMFIVDGEDKTSIDTVPSANEYDLDSQSYCLRGKDKITDVLTKIDNNFVFKELHTDDKCYLYFSKIKTPSEVILANSPTQGDAGAITGPSCNGNKNESCRSSGSPDNKKNNMAQNGVFSAEDDFGTSYYFRGYVQNNWVKFGQEGNDDLWWRIIRVNGNGTIRLIYAGKGSSPSTTGPSTQIATTYSDKINQKYNADYGDNTYVGFMYGPTGQSSYGVTHVNTNKSKIMTELETWYAKTTLGNLSSKIDVDTGFCNDRGLAEADHGNYLGPNGGYNKVRTAYAPVDRVWQKESTSADTTQRPTLKCGKDATAQKRDLFTGPSATPGGTDGIDGKVEGNNALSMPVGLITSDEVIYAGGFFGQNNDGYWLYTKQAYWTMSPYHFGGSYANVFSVGSGGNLPYTGVNSTWGVRPVINLKADTNIEFQDPSGADKGTTSNPYIVK